MNHDITPIGKTDFRNQEKKFGIKNDDRRRHIYIIGKTGVGKSTLIENMAISDIESGKGIGVVDPHGELSETLLNFIPENRLEDVIYFDPSDTDHPIAFNPLEQVSGELRHLIASSMMGVFKKIWPDVWSARMEYILNNTLLALLEYPGATLVGVLKMFSDESYRKKVVEGLEDPVVKHFWSNEFASYSQRYQVEAVGAIQNKVGQFVTNPLIRNILGQPRSSIDIKKIMDEGKILIVNLSKGKIGEDNASLLGAMMVTRIQLAAMSRAKDLDRNYRDFYLYVDEFQNFATDSFATILSEARKYRLSLTLAHQYINQLVTDGNTKVRDAIFGNVGTIVSFRVGANDAEFLEKEFTPEYEENDLVNLSKYHILIKLMIDGVASKPFSALTLPPREAYDSSPGETIIEYSRKKYATPKSHVEKKIKDEWISSGEVSKKPLEEQEMERTLKEALDSKLGPIDEKKKEKKRPHKTEKKNVDIGGLKSLIESALNEAGDKEEDND